MKATLATQTAIQPDVSEVGLRAQLITVALDILNRDGIEALTLRAVARGAGVSHGAPARHFDNLNDLKSEVTAVGYAMVAEGVRAADTTGSQGADPKKPLIAAVRAYVDFALDNPGLFALIIRTGALGGGNKTLRRERRLCSDQFLRLVRQAQAEGWKPDTDSNLLASSLWASAHGLATLWLHGAYQSANPNITLDEAIAAIFEVG